MLFALALDKMVFGQSPGWWSLAGSGLILGSAIYVAVRKGQVGDSELRERGADEEMIGRGEGGGAEEEMAMLGVERDDEDEEEEEMDLQNTTRRNSNEDRGRQAEVASDNVSDLPSRSPAL